MSGCCLSSANPEFSMGMTRSSMLGKTNFFCRNEAMKVVHIVVVHFAANARLTAACVCEAYSCA